MMDNYEIRPSHRDNNMDGIQEHLQRGAMLTSSKNSKQIYIVIISNFL